MNIGDIKNIDGENYKVLSICPSNHVCLEKVDAPVVDTVPELKLYEANMIEYGKKTYQIISDETLVFDARLLATYYDATWVFLQIRDYTKDDYWLNCAKVSAEVYATKYATPAGGNIPGYWKFTRGLTLLGMASGEEYKESVLSIARHGAFALPTVPLSETLDSTMSREVAYLILTALDAESLGEPLPTKYWDWVDQAYGHIDQWFKSKTAPYVRPFMAALTAQALIEHHERHPDARILSQLQVVGEGLIPLYNSGGEAFQYTDRETETGGRELAPDLNLLIVPLFGWLYKETKDTKYKDIGDAAFSGGARKAYLSQGKQFNQNYRWSMRYIKWRQG